jgi:hypothetical protein
MGMSKRLICVLLAVVTLSYTPASRAEDDKTNTADAPKVKKPSDEKPKPAPKLYRYKSQKKVGAGDAQATVVMVEDMISGRSETLYATSAHVLTALNEFAAGAPIEVQTERQKGKPTIVSIAKANLAPGEELTNHYVLVAWDKQKRADGTPIMGVKLKKFGKEITLQVPLVKNKETDDWAAPWGVEHALGKVQPGGVVEAKIKPGKVPQLMDLMPYRPPDRGKFVEMTEREVNDAQCIAFKLAQSDGITLTISLPGKPGMNGTQKVTVPDPRLLAMVKKLKPDTEIEVLLTSDDNYILRDLRVLGGSTGKSEDSKAGQ